jgi:hypothetical protein
MEVPSCLWPLNLFFLRGEVLNFMVKEVETLGAIKEFHFWEVYNNRPYPNMWMTLTSHSKEMKVTSKKWSKCSRTLYS